MCFELSPECLGCDLPPQLLYREFKQVFAGLSVPAVIYAGQKLRHLVHVLQGGVPCLRVAHGLARKVNVGGGLDRPGQYVVKALLVH